MYYDAHLWLDWIIDVVGFCFGILAVLSKELQGLCQLMLGKVCVFLRGHAVLLVACHGNGVVC